VTMRAVECKTKGGGKRRKIVFLVVTLFLFKLKNSGCYRSERLADDDLEVELSFFLYEIDFSNGWSILYIF
jgi:hypothetical protein